MFPVKVAKFLRTHPKAVYKVFYKDFVNICFENALFCILEYCILVFNYNCVLICELSCYDQWGYSKSTTHLFSTQP